MLVIDKKILMFNIKEAHFSKNPFDIEGCDFLIFPFCKNKVDAKGFVRYNKQTSIIDLTQNLDTIWQKMNRNSTRIIKQAEKEDIKIRVNYEYDKYFQVYENFIREKKMSSRFRIFGAEIISLDVIKKKGTLFVAEYQDEILAGHVFLEDDSNIEDLATGSKRLDNEKERGKFVGYANRLILWEAIKYAKEKGLKEFDLGGLFPEEKVEKDPEKKGINSFKLSFGGDIVQGYAYQKGYSKILKLAYRIYNYQIGRNSI